MGFEINACTENIVDVRRNIIIQVVEHHTSGDHLVLIGIPARFTTAVEPWMQFLHSASSAILIPG